MNANLYALIEAHFPREREIPCIVAPGGGVVSYGELASASGRIAGALRRAGCQPGDRVAVQADKHWQVIALYLACLRAGFVYLPLNTGYQRQALPLVERFHRMVREALRTLRELRSVPSARVERSRPTQIVLDGS